MKKDTSIEQATVQVEIFDTGIAMLAGLMIIPAVFAFSGGDPAALGAGPSLMFITMPKIFASMGFGVVIGIMFFALVLFAALTSAIALTESAVATFADEFGWNRVVCTLLIGAIMLGLGTLSCLGYGPLANVTIIGKIKKIGNATFNNGNDKPVAILILAIKKSAYLKYPKKPTLMTIEAII
jgi:NSS family neurotransmitter:Na+ symporter